MKPKIAVVGLGRMGKEHLRILTQQKDCDLVAAVDVDESKLKEFQERYGVRVRRNIDDLPNEVDAVVIATPTSTHFEIAKRFLSKGKSVFIEKPITSTVKEARQLINICKGKKCFIQVGHIERFNPAFSSALKFINEPLFIESHRLAPLAFRSLDIDVLLDLMIHDVDIVLKLTRSKPQSINAIGVPVITEKIDIANARISFKNGCIANLTASRVSDKAMRRIRVFTFSSYISIDLLSNSASIYKIKSTVKDLSGIVMQFSTQPRNVVQDFVFKNLIEINKVEVEKYEPLEKELQNFINAVSKMEKPEATGEEALEALAIVDKIRNRIDKILKNICPTKS